MPNRLAHETSPYLLQHAENPVDWWPWSAEAFAEARRRNVPVLLSVGYSSCHWCHVMAHESFEDEVTAGLLNEHFVAVKVDREERPDVDAVYMEAVQAATGQGGWPMTVFLTPEAEPFYFGTYFPPAPRHGMPGFPQVLEGVRAAWRDRRDEVGQVAGRIVRDLSERTLALGVPAEKGAPAQPPAAEDLGAALLGLTREFDAVRGGFGGAPKFPPSMTLEFLLRHHARTGSEGALEMAQATCEAMARGGIYDQLGGGFARYSVDAEWVVPHFEKMLYDNALLCRVYAHLWRATGSELARRVALETADFLVRELRTDQGGFASALDADSDDGSGRHVEGAYYVWTPQQLREVLGEEDALLAAAHFGVTEEGTFEQGSSVLQLPDSERLLDAGKLDSVRRRLLAAREQRPRPGRDDKVVAAWNGLAIAALAETGAFFDRPDLVQAATDAADLLVRTHMDWHARLFRTSLDGTAGAHAGVLEDYADVAEGFLALGAVTGEGVWVDFAGLLLDTVLTRFTGPDGALFDTADDAETLIRRPQDPTDNATPSGWTAACGALLTYAAYTGSTVHREAAERALGVVRALGPRAPRFISWGLAVAEALLDGPREVAVVGLPDDPATAALHRTALLSTAPGLAVAVGAPPSADDPTAVEVPLLANRPLADGRAVAYVCRGFVCDAPTTDPKTLTLRLS
ncbi:thioredoxin domain-containing protein [Streptomyces roseoverticillatus]|uniref:thioredoxin domain-containing protein n=1 Tax=Streptomyces roseoverticillatus TaxID=66429 RepID=UPI001F20BFA4|nr:thioredoxin domain-containing protein [Streptomyces roseoverticillatus]MCF3105598.1 thioredoxin domain-containing protein [Streptomyces roseoverticillatus]